MATPVAGLARNSAAALLVSLLAVVVSGCSQAELRGEDCAQTLIEGKVCGDDLVRFCERRYDPEINGDVCRTVLVNAGRDPEAIARAHARAEQRQLYGVTKHVRGRMGDELTLDAPPEHIAVSASMKPAGWSAGEYDAAEPGRGYVAVEMTIRNITSSTLEFDPSGALKLIDASGHQFEPTYLSGGDCSSDDFTEIELGPSDTRRGCIPFEVRKGARLRRIQLRIDGSDGTDKAIGEWSP